MDRDTDSKLTEAEAVAAIALEGAKAQVVEANGRTFLVMAEGLQSREVTDPHGLVTTPPGRLKQGVTLQTVDSLVAYTDRFKTADTVLFADQDTNSIVVALDYHEAGEVDGSDLQHKARFAEHVATMRLPFSIEWQTWAAIDGKLMPQLDFARFLEENGADVEAPSGADLLEICKDIQTTRNVDFRAAVRTNTDTESFEFSNEADARTRGGSMELPTKFQLRLPVYFGDATHALFAFLRWNLVGEQLVLGVKLHRAEHLRQAVFQQHVLDIAARVGRTAVFGKLA